jgi:hypothetical protein
MAGQLAMGNTGPSGPAGTSYDSVAITFHNMAVQFLQASVSNWPSDVLLPIAQAKLNEMEPKVAMDGFDKTFGRYVERLSRRDVTALFEAAKEPLVAAIDIEAKFTAANAATKETIWTYIGHLCKFHSVGKLYNFIPTPVLGAVNEAANDLKAKLDSGEIDPRSINPFELGQRVMAQFDPADLDKMMKDVLKNPDAMNAVMAQMSGFLGSAAGGTVSGPGGLSLPNVPGLDLASMMKFLGPPK